MRRLTGPALLREACDAGLTVRAEGEQLVIRGPRPLPAIAHHLLTRKRQVLAALAAGEPAVAWRVEAMRARRPAGGPLPFLAARDVSRGAAGCPSCGEPLAARAGGVVVRCGPCAHAAQLVTDEYANGGAR